MAGVFAADSRAAFEEANRLYEQGQFSSAATAYERLIAEGRASSALYFNLGNAWFKAGELGRAVASYRLAERLAPRDPDIQANLRMVRETVTGTAPARMAAWRRALYRLTLDEWTWLFLLSVWTGFGLMIASEFSESRRGGLRRLGLTAIVLAVVFGGALGSAWWERRGQGEAIVFAKEAVVRRGPLEVSPQLQVAPDGTELVVLDRKDGWLNVTGLARGMGWVQATNVIELPR
jgi:tetratricopeptide (TPR) repeat protein